MYSWAMYPARENEHTRTLESAERCRMLYFAWHTTRAGFESRWTEHSYHHKPPYRCCSASPVVAEEVTRYAEKVECHDASSLPVPAHASVIASYRINMPAYILRLAPIVACSPAISVFMSIKRRLNLAIQPRFGFGIGKSTSVPTSASRCAR